MKKVEITEQNKSLYEVLYSIKKGGNYSSKKSDFITACVAVGTMIAIMMASLAAYQLFEAYAIANLILTGVVMIGIFSCSVAALKLNIWLKVKEFSKKHPEIETDVKTKELAKELERYEELAKINYRKKSRRPSVNPHFSKTIMPEERLAYLERERNLLAQKPKDSTGYQKSLRK